MNNVYADQAFSSAATREQRLEQWIAQYGNMILRTCFVYLSDTSQAEDAMQDTFIKAWKYMDQYEHRNSISEKAWLVSIAINTCRDYHRSKWFRHVDRSKVLDKLPVHIETETPEDRILLLDILKLPVKQKQVVLLYYYHQLTLVEISAILGISKSTVHLRLQKAQMTLKRILTGREL